MLWLRSRMRVSAWRRASSSRVVALIDSACSGWRRSWLAAAKKRVLDWLAASDWSRARRSDAARRSLSLASVTKSRRP